MDGNRYCDNCKSTVPFFTWDLHEAVCIRNNYYCERCEQVLMKKDKQRHNDEYHVKIRCECGMEIDKEFEIEHKASLCKKRIVECKYCELPLHYDERRKHQKDCGVRTQPCERCNKRIKIKDINKHMRECSFDDMIIDHQNNFSNKLYCPFCQNEWDDDSKFQEHMFMEHSDKI